MRELPNILNKIFLGGLFLILLPLFTYAQFTPAKLTLSVSPELPEINTQAKISLDTKYSDFMGGKIKWFVDGVENDTFEDNKSLTFTTKNSGEKTNIKAVLIERDGKATEITRTITPLRVDVIISANTKTPSFYKGRALPSSGSTVTATALVFSGLNNKPENYTYVWKVNGEKQNKNITRNSNKVTFTPNFDTNMTVSVVVYDKNTIPVAKKTVVVPIVEPELYFYELNPLRGISPIALTKRYNFIGEEITLRAEPYYINTQNTTFNTQWKLDSKEVSKSTNSPLEITIQKQKKAGSALVYFRIYNESQFLQTAENSLTLQF